MLSQGVSSPDSLSINPGCIFTQAGDLPTTLANTGLVFDAFALDARIAWTPEPATGTLRPFWLGPRFSTLLDRLHCGKLRVADIPYDVVEVLSAAGLLTSPDRIAAQQKLWQEASARARREFAENLYTPVGGLIHPFHLSAIRRYYRFLIRAGAVGLGDDQSPRRFVAHNEPVARFFHHQLTAAVSAIAGETVKPSYVYLASYQPGAVLEKHTDRAQCEFSITFCVDYSPEPELSTPWPIFLDTRTGRVAVHQGIGDALFYRGCQVPHAREALAQGNTSTSIFFHYVRESFSGKLD
jgi:hypothetical protein